MMPPTNPSRITKRAAQACYNCRRKKTKCPGERPRCSSCMRLRQDCRYAGGSVDADRLMAGSTSLPPSSQHEHRISALEEKMQMVLDTSRIDDSRQVMPNGSVQAVPSVGESSVTDQGQTPSSWHVASDPNLLPARDTILKAVDAYFQYCHRQPLWLFDAQDASEEHYWSDQILLPVLALVTQCAPALSISTKLGTPEVYSDRARTENMLKIAKGTVNLQTIQGLCLLSFFNYTDLARLHASLARSLLQCSSLDVRSTLARTRPAEEQRRLFWSLDLLDQLYSVPFRSVDVIQDVSDPFYVEYTRQARRFSIKCPLLPQGSSHRNNSDEPGIWSALVQMTSVWGMLRNYVAECAEGRNSSPWSPDSGYTRICSALSDLESRIPDSHRYVNSKFSDRSSEEMYSGRDYWVVWLCVQILSHAVHCVLNHPFLYAQKASQHRKGPNMFWQGASESALLHSTWITRLLDMASRKGLELSNPLTATCAAVAGTLHFYHSRTAHQSVNNGALTNLETCRGFIRQMGTKWPLCQATGEILDQLIDQAAYGAPRPPNTSGMIALSTSLMWKLFGYTSPDQPKNWRKGLFDESFNGISRPTDDEETAIDGPDCDNNPEDLCAPSRNIAQSPTWFNAVTNAHTHKTRGQLQRIEPLQAATVQPESQPSEQWTWEDNIGGNTLMDMHYDFFAQPFDLDGSNSTRWDLGTL